MSAKKLPEPLVVSFVSDLMSAVRIQNAALQAGYELKQIASADEIAPPSHNAPEKQAAEPVFGQTAVLVDKLTSWQPALLIFDLTNEAIPWREWLAKLKSGPATRRFPIICFGPHVQVTMLEEAQARGADAVLARSRFFSSLSDLIAKHAHQPDRAGIAADCQESLSADGRHGLEEFNRGDYFEAHEYLEDAWRDDDGAARNLYKGVLQVAVAYLQIERQNYMGAVKMFLRARQWLEPLPDRCRGIDIGQLRADAEAIREALVALGPDRIGEFDRSLFKPVDFQ
ncbi:MAG: DUF309 domain-containing protein [Candidatus Promineifilaceae bacterium]|nr:DUF309 domain-containing protein [Candidatus Promineifilaceae bacterium]